MNLGHPIPVLRVFDSKLARAFYVDWLGFRVDWEHQFAPAAPRYWQISRDAAVLHLSEHFGDCSPGAKVIVPIDDAAAFHQELHSRPNPNMNPGLETMPWGDIIVEVIDPFSNRLVFSQARTAR